MTACYVGEGYGIKSNQWIGLFKSGFGSRWLGTDWPDRPPSKCLTGTDSGLVAAAQRPRRAVRDRLKLAEPCQSLCDRQVSCHDRQHATLCRRSGRRDSNGRYQSGTAILRLHLSTRVRPLPTIADRTACCRCRSLRWHSQAVPVNDGDKGGIALRRMGLGNGVN